MPRARYATTLLGALLLSSAACGGGGAPVVSEPSAPKQERPEPKCGVKASQSRPLVVEWPATDRAALEARAKRGLVAVRYDGCEMELLPRCDVPGSYAYTPITPKRERLRITTSDELYASLPLGAASLEGKLEQAGELNVAMTVVGTFSSERKRLSQGDLGGGCERATHVVHGLTVGAFDFFAGASVGASAGVTSVVASAGGATEKRRESLVQDGELERCASASPRDETPPAGCGAVLRLEVVPLDEQPPPPKPLARVSLGKLELARARARGEVDITVPHLPLPPEVPAARLTGPARWKWTLIAESRDKADRQTRKRNDVLHELGECERAGCSKVEALRGDAAELAAQIAVLAQHQIQLGEQLEAQLRVKKGELDTGAPSAAEQLVLGTVLAERAEQRTGDERAKLLRDAAHALGEARALSEATGQIGWWARYELAKLLEQSGEAARAGAIYSELADAGEQAASWRVALAAARSAPTPAALRHAEQCVKAAPEAERTACRRVAMARAYFGRDYARTVKLAADLLRRDETARERNTHDDALALIAASVEQLGGPGKQTLASLEPALLARVAEHIARDALARGDRLTALDAYELISKRAPDSLQAAIAARGTARLHDSFGNTEPATAARKLLAERYTVDSDWAKQLRKARDARGQPDDDAIRAAIAGVGHELLEPLPPGTRHDGAAAKQRAAARVRGLMKHCGELSPPSQRAAPAQLGITIDVYREAPVKVSVQAPKALAAIAACVRGHASEYFGTARFGVKTTVVLKPGE